MLKYVCCLLALGISSVSAQNIAERKIIQSKSNLKELKQLEEQFRLDYIKKKEEAYQIAQKRNIPIFKKLEDGRVAELQYFEYGTPIYNVSYSNLNAAATTRASALWNGGSLGLNLNGQGMIIGEWDGGAVRSSHQEFATSRVIQKDGAATLNDHATHVAGTLIATGVNNSAKGMAHEGTLWANDWNSDLSEATAQAADGLLVSNHSYGYQASSLQNWQFGYYDSNSANWDNLVYNAPYYLPCIAAGNDRNTTANTGSGGYDLITGRGLAKNVLTVGAVNIQTNYVDATSVVMSSFSCWGPTDDGRIKPDVVGAGVGILSSTAGSDNSYASYNGTSMATPNVAGSLILLQQHYKNLNSGNFMKAATLKALAIHTADEAGIAPGPDYQFGWGLVNVKKAAELITNRGTSSIIQERTLANGTSHTLNVTALSNSPIEITICWTDPKGTPASGGIVNPTNKMLVHDLDMRAWQGTNFYMPWILDPASPSSPATKGDNVRDNVEKIIIDNPTIGQVYSVEIFHKGTLSASQDYSLIMSGGSLNPSATVSALNKLFAKYTKDKETGVNGLVVNFTDESSRFTHSTPSITDWTWNFDVNGMGGASPSTFSGKVPPAVSFSKSGVYKVSLTVSNGSTTDIYTSDITVDMGKPVLSVTNLQTNELGEKYCVGQVDLSWQDNSDETAFEVQRRENVATSIFSTIKTLPANQTTYSDNTIEYAKNYVYRVMATKTNITPALSQNIGLQGISFTTAIDEQLEDELSIYPNPAKQQITIKSNKLNIQNASIKILNNLGQIIYDNQINNQEQVNLPLMSKGLYWVTIQTDRGVVRKKIVIE
jgi:PKD repeat protein